MPQRKAIRTKEEQEAHAKDLRDRNRLAAAKFRRKKAETQRRLKQENSKLKERIAILHAELTRCRETPSFAQQGQVTELQEELTCSRETANLAQQGQVTELQEELTRSRETANLAQQQVTELQEELTRSRETANLAQQQVTKLKAELTRSRETTGRAQQQVTELQEELTCSRETASELESRIEFLTELVDSLRLSDDNTTRRLGSSSPVAASLAGSPHFFPLVPPGETSVVDTSSGLNVIQSHQPR